MAITWMMLKDLREMLDMTQSELAEIIGVHPKTIVNWESDGVPERSEYKLRRRLGTEIEYLELKSLGDLQGLSLEAWKQQVLSRRIAEVEQQREEEFEVPKRPVDIESELLMDMGRDPRAVARARGLKPFTSRELLEELLFRDDLRLARQVDRDLARFSKERAAERESNVSGSGEDAEDESDLPFNVEDEWGLAAHPKTEPPVDHTP